MAATIQNPFALLKKDAEEKPTPVATESSPKLSKKAAKPKTANGSGSPKTSKKKSSESVPAAAASSAGSIVEKKASSSTTRTTSAPAVARNAEKPQHPKTPAQQFFALFKKFYLMFYNIAQAIGWTMILSFIVLHFVQGGTYQTLWPKIAHNVVIFQGLAFLEVFHAAVGLVPSSAVTTFIQIFSRVLLAVAVVPNVPQLQSHWLVATMVVSWCIVEMIRYPFYALSIFGRPSSWHVWLRYSAFWILYPTGGGSEAGLLILAVPYVAKSNLFRLSMPNQWNFAFDFAAFIQFFGYSYVVGLPYMMSHMVGQRRSALAKLSAEKKNQ